MIVDDGVVKELISSSSELRVSAADADYLLAQL
jgi:hypothetical protein